MSKNEYEAELLLFKALPDGWDGHGSLTPTEQVIGNALTVLDGLKENPSLELTPNSNGTVSFEWEFSGTYIHLEVGRTLASMYVRRADHETLYFNYKDIHLNKPSFSSDLNPYL